MKSDIQEMFKETKPSLTHMVSEEIAQSGRTPSGFGPPRQSFTYYYFIGALLITLIAVGGGLYFLSQGGTSFSSPKKLISPASFFATESSRTINVRQEDRQLFIRLMQDSMKEEEQQGTVKRIIIKIQNGAEERFATFEDFLNFYRIPAPDILSPHISPPLMVFIYYGRDGSRVGFALKARDNDRVLADMLWWEPSLATSLKPLLFGEEPDITALPFEDRTYRNIDWRFVKLSQKKDLGFAYTVFSAGNYFVLTTSKEAMETVIKRSFDSR